MWLQRNGYWTEEDEEKDGKHLQKDEMRFKEDEAMANYEELSLDMTDQK